MISITKWSAALMLFGRAWQHFRFDGPWRQYFWDETLFGWFVNIFTSLSWKEYVTSPVVDQLILGFQSLTGVLLLVGAVSVLLLESKFEKIAKWGVWMSFIIMTIFFLLIWKSKTFQIGFVLEQAAQLGILLLVMSPLVYERIKPRFIQLLKWCIALTFVGHGLFALGFHLFPAILLI